MFRLNQCIEGFSTLVQIIQIFDGISGFQTFDHNIEVFSNSCLGYSGCNLAACKTKWGRYSAKLTDFPQRVTGRRRTRSVRSSDNIDGKNCLKEYLATDRAILQDPICNLADQRLLTEPTFINQRMSGRERGRKKGFAGDCLSVTQPRAASSLHLPCLTVLRHRAGCSFRHVWSPFRE